ncbi:hypothetical protein PbB2_00081 [Candidatus Phycosocius bacilliformis]|uniref:GcrA cell cycle regulator n=1 Tax=Candidatus Phycosocius bacilliformis TaxID=1445552 RepID=A0A2P2E5T4_9PROT|nr:GcrA family cell cycle regulator [Candidatus Phycosocius bacilliformis]GBF56425.1 hypothetical protein PbB2_00081 [Candidatus Phycosocius bacilliformis]
MTEKWTDEATELAVMMRKRGDTAAAIAHALARQLGFVVSRNAVIGKMKRMEEAGKIPKFERPTTPRLVNAVKPAPRPKPTRKWRDLLAAKRAAADPDAAALAAEQIEVQPAPKPLADIYTRVELAGRSSVTLTDLRQHHCRFPQEDAQGRTVFCGKPRVAGSSWCAEHQARCVVVIEPKAKKGPTRRGRGPARHERAVPLRTVFDRTTAGLDMLR